jgi:hypothetical protein
VTTTELFQIAGLMTVQTGAILTVLILYINAKIDPVKEQVDLLVQYMISHEGKIAILEERTGGPAKKQ